LRRLGLSLYPEHSTLEDDKKYLDTASKLGYSRIFASLLELGDDKDKTINRFKETIAYGNKLGFVTIVDMNPRLFKALGISYDDLSFFHDIGAAGIRLDEGFSGMEEAKMTHNPFGLKVEINMSSGTHYLDNIISYHPDTNNLLGCHNFYPQRYTGLGEAFFIKWSNFFKERNIHSAAFISSHSATFGPWPVQDGLPTLEDDRDLPISTQVKHLLLSGVVDDVIIGNAYASDQELQEASEAFYAPYPVLKVDFSNNATDLEKEVILKSTHVYRGDASDYLLRSTMTRVVYKQGNFPAHDTQDIKRGDIIIVNEKYGQYKGETQIALRDIKNDGRRNVVGHLNVDEAFLLNYIEPWSSFKLAE